MSKPWGNIGAWAAEAEEREAAATAAAAAPALAGAEPQNFPSLRESVSAKPKKKKMSLNAFFTDSSGGSDARGGGGGSKGLTPDEMMRLPTGPKERSAEEMQYGRLGGRFSSYGRSGAPPNRSREDGDTSWGGRGGGGGRRSYGGFEDGHRPEPEPPVPNRGHA